MLKWNSIVEERQSSNIDQKTCENCWARYLVVCISKGVKFRRLKAKNVKVVACCSRRARYIIDLAIIGDVPLVRVHRKRSVAFTKVFIIVAFTFHSEKRWLS